MLHRQRAVTAVEITHLAGADMRRTDGQSRRGSIGQIEIDQLEQGLLQRRGRIEAGMIGAEWIGLADMRQRIRSEEAGNAVGDGRPIG